MPVLNVPTTVADFQLLDWQGAIARSNGATCESFYYEFCKIADDAEKLSPGTAASARMLIHLSGLHLHADNIHEPLQPMVHALSLDDDDVAFLKQVESVIDNPELRARMQDLIWLKAKDFPAAMAAIGSYIEAAKAFVASDGIAATERIERAARLALSLKRTSQLDAVATFIHECLFEEPRELNFISARFAQILLETGRDEPTQCALRCHQLAERAGDEGKFELRRRLLELAAAWYLKAASVANQLSVRLAHAESYVVEAEALAAKDKICFGQPAHLIECAVQALRKLPDTKARIDELLRQRDKYNAQFISQMIPLSERLNLDDIAEHARQHVTCADVHGAIRALAFISTPRDVAKLKEEVSKSNEQYLSRQIFGTTRFGATGRTAARSAPINPAEEASSPAFRAEMLSNAALGRTITVQGLIEPARLHIMDHNRVRAEDVAAFIWNNPLVPFGRERLFIDGLLAGFRGDYVTSTHLLIPQLEHLIRGILYNRGKRTSTYSPSGIEKESDLNATLFDPDLVQILGENLVFDLQGLLVEAFGSNLRNEMAHGMRGYNGFFTVDTIYCWWLTLHLLCLPLRQIIKEADNGEAK